MRVREVDELCRRDSLQAALRRELEVLFRHLRDTTVYLAVPSFSKRLLVGPYDVELRVRAYIAGGKFHVLGLGAVGSEAITNVLVREFFSPGLQARTGPLTLWHNYNT